ncbi:MAG: diacylglycerol/lipid kinase family protein [Candidatus Dormibacteria bacterium]
MTTDPATLVIVNPASAGGQTLRRWPEILAALREFRVAVTPHLTAYPGEATERVREALLDGVQRIVVVGGDGTLNEVVNGCFQGDGAAVSEDFTIGVIPCGTGGDFARHALGLTDDPRRNARLIADGSLRSVDVGKVAFDSGTVRYFVNIADCGIGGEVVARVNRNTLKGTGLRGSAVFLGTSLSTLMRFGGRAASIDIDGELVARRVQQVVVANGRAFGGGMLIAPRAEIDDGLFDVVIVAEMGRLEALRAMPALYRGNHLGHRAVEVRRGRRVRITAEDGDELLFDIEGEQVERAPATITCMPGALKVAAPS